MTDQKHDEEALGQFIQIGAEIAGGAAIGGLTGGLAGFIGGAATPIAIRMLGRVAVEFRQRVSSHREEIRAGATIAYTAMKIEENIAAGQQLRQDDFFQKQPNDRSPAEEIAEGVLLVAQREHEEKKLRYYGKLLGNIPFMTKVGRDLANFIIKTSESLSYRQLCLISLLVRKKEIIAFKPGSYFTLNQEDATLTSLLIDIYNLSQQGILASDFSDPPATIFTSYDVPIMGKLIFDLMKLKDIDKAELEKIATHLSHAKQFGSD
jgi:hypothetical protein